MFSPSRQANSAPGASLVFTDKEYNLDVLNVEVQEAGDPDTWHATFGAHLLQPFLPHFPH